jgi:hypothetical protein
MAATLLLGWLLISLPFQSMRGSHQFLEQAGGISSTRPENPNTFSFALCERVQQAT